jgi:hypothetical protein
MLATYDEAAKHGYRPTYFLQMVEQYKGVGAARRLLRGEQQQGLFHLHKLGLLRISMEALVLDERFRCLFSEKELAEARRRLHALGYV